MINHRYQDQIIYQPSLRWSKLTNKLCQRPENQLGLAAKMRVNCFQNSSCRCLCSIHCLHALAIGVKTRANRHLRNRALHDTSWHAAILSPKQQEKIIFPIPRRAGKFTSQLQENHNVFARCFQEDAMVSLTHISPAETETGHQHQDIDGQWSSHKNISEHRNTSKKDSRVGWVFNMWDTKNVIQTLPALGLNGAGSNTSSSEFTPEAAWARGCSNQQPTEAYSAD